MLQGTTHMRTTRGAKVHGPKLLLRTSARMLLVRGDGIGRAGRTGSCLEQRKGGRVRVDDILPS